jgi:aminoglycoside phosphotransferase (APT) family kinase protein
MFVPTTTSELTTSWLTEMLHEAGALGADREVSGFEAITIGEGISLLGLVQRIELSYSEGAGEAGPASVVIKFAHPLPENRGIANNTRMYEREIEFFNQIAPHIDMPKTACYFARMAPGSDMNAVVIEDLRAYRNGDQVAGIDAGEARQIIDAIAPLHAAFWGRTDLPVLDNFMRIDTEYADLLAPGWQNTWERCRDQFGHIMPEEVREALPRFAAQMPQLHQLMGKRVQAVIHGDVRLDNVMFGQDPDQHPVMMIDWQNIMISNPMQDLGYMMGQSVETDVRREHEDGLVSYYRDRVTGHGVEGYSLEQAVDDYDTALLWSMNYALIIGGAFDPANERGRLLTEKIVGRATTAVADRGLLRMLAA